MYIVHMLPVSKTRCVGEHVLQRYASYWECLSFLKNAYGACMNLARTRACTEGKLRSSSWRIFTHTHTLCKYRYTGDIAQRIIFDWRPVKGERVDSPFYTPQSSSGAPLFYFILSLQLSGSFWIAQHLSTVYLNIYGHRADLYGTFIHIQLFVICNSIYFSGLYKKKELLYSTVFFRSHPMLLTEEN